MKKITAPDILEMKAQGRRIPVLTAYGFPMARLLDSAGIPVLMVGDSAGMVEAGYPSTIPVTVDELIYHTKAVVAGRKNALVVSDMPFGSYQTGALDAKRNAARLVKEGGAEAVKLEGGKRSCPAIKAVAGMDIPVMGHIGLTPQSLHKLGGYRVQGRTDAEAKMLMDDALAVEHAGAFSIVIECVPEALAAEITAALGIPTIGIGAGARCDGQVLVLNDLLGLTLGMDAPRFVKRYLNLAPLILKEARAYRSDVEAGRFPSKRHSF